MNILCLYRKRSWISSWEYLFSQHFEWLLNVEILTVYIRSHSWYIKTTYILWLGSQSSHNLEFMKIEIVRFIIHVAIINWIINLTTASFNMSYTPTYRLKFSTSMIKTNHLRWHVTFFANETPNFITHYELRFLVYKKLVIYIFCN